MRTSLIAGAVALAAVISAAPAAKADVYFEAKNGNADSGILSNPTNIAIQNLVIGAYTLQNGGVNIAGNNPMGVDFSNFSTVGGGSPGTLQIFVSSTNLTSPIGSILSFLTQASGNVLSGLLKSMTVTTYVDAGNGVFATTTMLDKFTIGQNGVGSPFTNQASALYTLLSSPFSETFEIDLTLGANSDVRSDVSLLGMPVPEPATWAMMIAGLLGLLAVRRRYTV